jgi:hypothetical protein
MLKTSFENQKIVAEAQRLKTSSHLKHHMPLKLLIDTVIVTLNKIVTEKQRKKAIMFNKPALLNRDKVKELCQKYWLGDVSQTKADFDMEFTPFENGAKNTYNWYKENKWL